MRQDLVSKSGEAMFRYHPGSNFQQQFQHTTEYLSQVAALHQGPYGDPGVVQQHGSPTTWSGSSHIELSPTVTSPLSSSHNSTIGAEQWGYNHGNQQPHMASPGGHLSGSPAINGMTGYVHHDGYMAHSGLHGPESVTQALYTPALKGATYDYYVRTPTYRYNPQTGKTRTKDKYRVVYTDHQRQKLEEEFRYNRYITIRRKAEIAMALGLSDRQVKIWFQNRRAKERKLQKKIQHANTSGQQHEKGKAPSHSQTHRDQPAVKQETNKATIKEESLQRSPGTTTKPNAVTSVANASLEADDTIVNDNGMSDTKYARNVQLKTEYDGNDDMRVSAYPEVVVSTGHITAGNFAVQREPILQYTHA